MVATTTIGELFADDETREIVLAAMPFLDNPHMSRMAGGMTLLDVAAMKVELDHVALADLDERLSLQTASATV